MVRLLLTNGQRYNIALDPCVAGQTHGKVYPDKGYGSHAPVVLTERNGSVAVTPPLCCQQPRGYDRARYRLRNKIQR